MWSVSNSVADPHGFWLFFIRWTWMLGEQTKSSLYVDA